MYFSFIIIIIFIYYLSWAKTLNEFTTMYWSCSLVFTCEQQYVVLTGTLKSLRLKDQLQTIDIDQSLRKMLYMNQMSSKH